MALRDDQVQELLLHIEKLQEPMNGQDMDFKTLQSVRNKLLDLQSQNEQLEQTQQKGLDFVKERLGAPFRRVRIDLNEETEY